MISIADDNEFTVLIADFIETIARLHKFSLELWIGSELPITVNESCDYHFMQEGVRISAGKQVLWIFYDTITMVRLKYES
jgi:hypothetical protein